MTTRTRALLATLLIALAAADGAAFAQTATPAEDEDDPPAAPRKPRETRGGAKLRFGVDAVRLEAGHWPSAPEAERGATLRAQPFLQWQPDRRWELRLGARLDADWQDGGPRTFDRATADWGDSYLRLRHEDTRVTVGAQTIVWGRVDAVPLIDRVSRVDLRRFALDELSERRLPQWAVRWEQTFGEVKLDAVWLPHFQAAAFPVDGSVWHPVNRARAQVIGVEPAPALAPFFRGARIEQQEDGSGGVALRATRAGDSLDLGLTVAHTRQPLPYFRLEPAQGRLVSLHPYTRFAAIDGEMAVGGATWRMELGYTLDQPLTARDGRMLRAHALDWVGAVEFFPGGKDTRVNLQLVAHEARVDEPVLEVKRFVGANGEVETRFGQDRWKASMRFAVGFNVRDTYVAPRLAFIGWEPHEFYVAAHLFSGEDRALAGFHRQHDAVVIGVKTKF